MDPKIRDEIATAVGVGLVYLALDKKRNAEMALLAGLGAGTALWVVHRWSNREA